MYSQWLEDDDEQREPHNKIGIRGWRQYLLLVTDAYNDTQRCSWFSIYMEMTRGSKTVPAGSRAGESLGGVEEDNNCQSSSGVPHRVVFNTPV